MLAPGDGASLHYDRHRPEQTTLYRLVQQHAASFIAHTEASTGSELPRFIKDEFDAFLDCGILACGFLRLRCGDCGHDKLLAFSCERRGFCPSCGARLLARVFDIDVRPCPICGGAEFKILAAILDRAVIEKILRHLGLDPRLPPRAPARPVRPHAS